METLFRSAVPQRDKFLARLFGLFSEEIVRHWASDPNAPYEDLGRPTLRWPDDTKFHTLDFTFRHRADGRVFVAEMKAELEWEGYRYLRLVDAAQIEHHERSAAFQKLIATARNSEAVSVRVGGKPVAVSGAILVWGATAAAGIEGAKEVYGFGDVLSVEMMLMDLRAWKTVSWCEYAAQLRRWTEELFDGLTRMGMP